MNKYFVNCVLFGASFLITGSCKKFVQISPPTTEITGITVYSNNASASAVMTGVYDEMITSPGFVSGNNSLSYLGGLLSDELKNYTTNPILSQFYENALTSSSKGNSNGYFWPFLYDFIYVSNAVIEGLNASSSVTDSIKQQLIGEAEFTRAFMYFYAVNLYGDVPLATMTSYAVNNSLPRTPSLRVYQQIIMDLKDAQLRLNINYVNNLGLSTSERTRPNKGAATALLARAYLYTSKWDSAEMEATSVINNSNFSLPGLDSVFLANSAEAIWQLQPVYPGYNTFDALYFVLTSAPGDGGGGQFAVAIDTNLINSFEPADQRLVNWVGTYIDTTTNLSYYYPYKYKVYLPNQPLTEYLMVLRLAEQYLIRAEARLNQGNTAGAVTDLNIIRMRAGLAPYAGATDETSLASAILHERRVELFTEWGHRWLDLKRTGNLDAVMSVVTPKKGGLWNADKALMPLPLSDLQNDPNLTQNPGY